MKTTTRKIEFIAERNERLFVSSLKRVYAVCEDCGQQVEMLSPEAAASASNLTPRTIYRLIEARKIHFAEDDEGQMLVCCESLVRGENLV